jgi:predicted GNAT superfamily acetyltransferase
VAVSAETQSTELGASRLTDAVEVRLVRSHAEYGDCEQMGREIWGVSDRNIVPRELLLTMQLNGGLVHGAFLPDGRLVGFCFGFAGVRDGRLRLCSHQLGVLPEFRESGIGIALKQAQRRDALRLGYQLISWTFDPLEARNAYLNLHRLGCIARLYDRDHYGAMEDDLNRGLPSDRFEAEWWLAGWPRPAMGSDLPIALAVNARGEPEVRAVSLAQSAAVLIEIPSDFQAVKRADHQLAARWRRESRAALEAALDDGLIAVDFLRRGAYVMARETGGSPPDANREQPGKVHPEPEGEPGRRR